jgi:valyl-tRNA synthetase
MLPNVQRFITAANDKLETLTNEEKLTKVVRQKMHKSINERTQEVVDKLVKQIQDYAETLHQQVCKQYIWKTRYRYH